MPPPVPPTSQTMHSQAMASSNPPYIVLEPATRTTVVTTTTTTTTSYAPIGLPPLPPPAPIKDPKLYPLLNAPLPRSLRKFQLTFPGGTRAMFHDPTYSDDEIDAGWVDDEPPSGEGWQQLHPGTLVKDKEPVTALSDALDRYSVRKRAHGGSGRHSPIDPSSGDVIMGGADDPARSPPPRKKARAGTATTTTTTTSTSSSAPVPPLDSSPAAAPISASTSRANGGPPSPLPSPHPSPASAVLWTPNPSPPARDVTAAPFQPDLSMTALMALPELLNQYVALPQSLQSHYLFTLLRHSPLPVLRTIHSVLTPTLARDFVGMLPPELASYILQFLPPAALFAAAKVSRSWRNLIDSDPVIWMSLLKRTGTWFGGGSEEAFLRKVESYRSRYPPIRAGSPPLPISHPFKLLFKSRRTVQTRWTQKTPKRLTFAAHGASVVTCLLFSRQRIISASDDHSIHIYDPTSGGQLKMLEGHAGGVWALAVCSRRIRPSHPTRADDPPRYHDVLVSGSTDRTVRIWDLSTGRNTHVFGGHTSTVRCLAIVRPTMIEKEDGGYERWPKRTMIVTGSRDHSLRLWRLPGRRDDEYRCKGADPEDDPADEDVSQNPFHIRLLEGHGHAVRALAAHGRTLVSGSYDATVRVWDLATGDCKFILTGHTQKVYSVVLDPVRQQACSGSMDGSVRIWSLKTGQNLHTLTGHSSLVGLLSLSPSTLVSAAADSTLRIWNPDTGAPLHALQAHQGAITCFQHDEFKVVSGSDGALKMWDTRDGTVMRDLLTNIMGVWQVVFDERFCVAASNLQEHTFLDVWDFGEDGEADVEAARIVEDDDESDVGDLDDDNDDEEAGMSESDGGGAGGGGGRGRGTRPSTHRDLGLHLEVDDDDDLEMDDEDALMTDASSSSRRMDVTPTPSERRLPREPSASSNSWRAWSATASSSGASSASRHPTLEPRGPASPSHAVVSPNLGPSAPSSSEERQYFGRDEALSSASGPFAASSSSRHRGSLGPRDRDTKGKGRALPQSVTSPLYNPSSSNTPFHQSLASASVAAAGDSTPPTSTAGPAPPNPHSSSWVAGSYTFQAAQMNEDTPSKRPRRHGR